MIKPGLLSRKCEEAREAFTAWRCFTFTLLVRKQGLDLNLHAGTFSQTVWLIDLLTGPRQSTTNP